MPALINLSKLGCLCGDTSVKSKSPALIEYFQRITVMFDSESLLLWREIKRAIGARFS
jgi:hypothetical protein